MSMKKYRFLTIALCIVMVLPLLVGCKNNKSPDTPDIENTSYYDTVPDNYDLENQTVGVFYAEHIASHVIGKDDETDIVFSKIHEKNLLVEEMDINPEIITLEAELMNDLGFNSLELADLVVLCEEKFNIIFDESALPSLLTVGDVVAYIEENS
jgi:acyl carrier protein